MLMRWYAKHKHRRRRSPQREQEKVLILHTRQAQRARKIPAMYLGSCLPPCCKISARHGWWEPRKG